MLCDRRERMGMSMKKHIVGGYVMAIMGIHSMHPELELSAA